MSYSLYRVQWQTRTPHGCSIPEHVKTSELCSFHLTSDDAAIFIRKIAEDEKNSPTKHVTHGSSDIHTHDGTLYKKVKLAREKGEFGFWGAPGQDGVKKNRYEFA